MLRAPEIKMQWGTSFLVTLIVGGPLLFRSAGESFACRRALHRHGYRRVSRCS